MLLLQAPREVLSWERRAPFLLQEIVEADADVVCLQEVNHYGEPVKGPSRLRQYRASCLRHVRNAHLNALESPDGM